MTVEEKQKKLAEHCLTLSNKGCLEGECPLAHVYGSCYGNFDTIERNYEIVFGKEPDEVKNPYWSRICKLAENQRNKGVKEYGRGLEADTAEIDVRLNRIEEELIDALMYIEHLRDAVHEKEGCKGD